jgi:hypothetical protein
MLRSNGAIIERRWVIIAGIVVLAILVLGLARETLQGWVDVFLEFVEALGMFLSDFTATRPIVPNLNGGRYFQVRLVRFCC